MSYKHLFLRHLASLLIIKYKEQVLKYCLRTATADNNGAGDVHLVPAADGLSTDRPATHCACGCGDNAPTGGASSAIIKRFATTAYITSMSISACLECMTFGCATAQPPVPSRRVQNAKRPPAEVTDVLCGNKAVWWKLRRDGKIRQDLSLMPKTSRLTRKQ